MVASKLYAMLNTSYISPALNETGLLGTAILTSDKVEYLSFTCNVLLLAARKTTRFVQSFTIEKKL